jgi:hypothetical protein
MSDSPDFSQAFESLRAEFESAWLSQAYLQPREFGLMAGQHSILVIGMEGTGKTALEMQLREYAARKEKLCPLVASWRPQPIGEHLSSDQVVETFLAQAMNSLAFAFLQEVAQRPEAYRNSTSWVQDFIIWFTHFYLQGDREFHLSRLSEHATPAGLETIKKITSSTPRQLLSQTATPSDILSHLTESTKKLGFDGVWIFIEDLDVIFRASPDKLAQNLKDLLSTLDIFETPAFSIKIIAPSELGLRLQTARGVKTRRFNVHYLKWQYEELLDIVERRISLVLQEEQISITDICGDKAWLNWLKQYAGETPRGWLDLTRPIVVAYLKKKGKLAGSEWQGIYRKSPPLLSLDLENNRVFIGHGEVLVSAIGYKLLRYLYETRYRACSKSELYYCAHKGLSREPRSPEDDGWEDQSSWEGVLDTALWRLRQAIEWDKGSEPLYIVSTRGKGQIRLENTG